MQVDSVERFVVAHGQIFINQFQNYPRKRLRCAKHGWVLEIGGLRAAAASRRGSHAWTGRRRADMLQLLWSACAFAHARAGGCTPTFLPPGTPCCCPCCASTVKEVRNSAFVSTLKERMSQLRHSKLYKAHKKEVVRARAVNRNPMKVGAGR